MKSSVVKCRRCKLHPAHDSWTLSACADGNKKREFKLCSQCDVDLNAMVMRFLNVPHAEVKIEKYRKERLQ